MASTASKDDAVRVLEHCWVSPPERSVPETSIPLTFFDVVWLSAGSVDRLFFYRLPISTSHFIQHLLPNFKSTLSLTLQHFYPLAGHVRRSPATPGEFELYYLDGDSVSLVVAESDADFEHVSGDLPRPSEELRRLAPTLPLSLDMDSKSSLMTLQVTLFPNQGICIGVSVKHVACDGTSSVNFLKSWAATHRFGSSVPLVAAPRLFDRSNVVDPGNLCSTFLDGTKEVIALQSQVERSVVAKGDTSFIATFSLGREDIQKLKRYALAGSEAPFHCSTFVVAIAYLWVCLVRTCGWSRDRVAHFAFMYNCRAGLVPPLPADYFGNCVGACFVDRSVGDLVGDDGVRTAAQSIGKAIQGLRDGALKGADKWMEKFMSVMRKQPLLISGSPKFEVYDIDFGWGRPVKLEMPSILTGSVSLTESREEDGGIEFSLALTKPDMDEFVEHFSTGLGLLSN